MFGGNLVLILVGAIFLGLGQVLKENGNNSKNKQVFHEFFDDVEVDPVSHCWMYQIRIFLCLNMIIVVAVDMYKVNIKF